MTFNSECTMRLLTLCLAFVVGRGDDGSPSSVLSGLTPFVSFPASSDSPQEPMEPNDTLSLTPPRTTSGFVIVLRGSVHLASL